ncbi:MAG: hypothetical protein ACHQNA_01085 [Acidimicrobiales bacterium]
MNGRSSATVALTPRTGRSLPIAGVAAVVWVVSVASLAIGVLTAPSSGPDAPSIASLVAIGLAVVSPVTVGAILVIRLPRNLIGWLLPLSGLSLAVNLGASGLVNYPFDGIPGSVVGADQLALLAQVTFLPFVVGLGLFMPLLYPSGHLPSPRWRPVALLGLVAITCGTIKNLLTTFPPGTYPPSVQNPLAVGGGAADLVAVLDTVTTLIGVIALPLVAASLVSRYRRAYGIERQQFKWLALGAAIFVPALVVGIVLSSESSGLLGAISTVAWVIGLFGFGLLPVAVGIAVLRYRLYDIDRLISRTIGWATVTGVLVVVFAGAILLFQAVLAPLIGGNTVAVAASTLVVAALFQPLRRRVQARVDRRFNRSRYDAERTLSAFAGRLRDEVDLVQLATEIETAVGRTVQPASVSLWLRIDRNP